MKVEDALLIYQSSDHRHIYCGFCGMEITDDMREDTEWKAIHFKFHNIKITIKNAK